MEKVPLSVVDHDWLFAPVLHAPASLPIDLGSSGLAKANVLTLASCLRSPSIRMTRIEMILDPLTINILHKLEGRFTSGPHVLYKRPEVGLSEIFAVSGLVSGRAKKGLIRGGGRE